MIDSLIKNVEGSKGFAEIRVLRSWSNRVVVRGKEIETLMSGSQEAVSARVLYKGAWGFATSNTIDNIDTLVSKAMKLAKASSRKPINAKLADIKPQVARKKIRVKTPGDSVHINEKAKRCIELSKRALTEKKVRTVDTSYADAWGEWVYVNSEGSRIEYFPARSLFTISAFVKGKELLQSYEKDAGLRGVEILDNKESLVDAAVTKALRLLKSFLPPKGVMPVVVDPRMAGVLAHEAVGHACEADAVINKTSILGNKMGKRIGSKCVSISDDPTLPRMYGSYPFDDEGTPTQKTVLVNKGVLKGFLHSRETAAKLGQKPTGNARAQGVGSFPLVRMSNTFFEKGDQSLNELLAPIKRGVFVEGMKGGVTEPSTGVFQFASEAGYLIENGELTKPLRDIVLMGNIMEVLKQVEACGKKWQVGTPGTCGKAGQGVPVSDGGPHIRIRKMLVGG